MNTRQVRGLTLAVSSAVAIALGWIVLRSIDERGVDPGMRFHKPPPLAELGKPDGKPATSAGNWLDPIRPEAWKYFIPQQAAMKIYPIADSNNNRYDPWTYYSEKPNQNRRVIWPGRPDSEFWWRTNSLGLREDGELADPPADLRVLVVGDSHTVGACNNSETHPNLLELALAARHPGKTIEVLNASMPGFSFYQYSGTLHKFLAWKPQVFVVAVYGGNDFAELSYNTHQFTRTPQSPWRPEQLSLRNRALDDAPQAMGQCLNSIFDLHCRPEEREWLLRRAVHLCSQMHEICTQRGIPMLVAFLPAACDCEWREPHEELERGKALLALPPEDLKTNAWFGEGFLVELAKLGIKTVDMRPIFAREPEPPYWRLDLHLNLRGHRLVADALLPVVEPLLDELAR